MIPRSISASALNVAESCMARYKAENIDRAPRGSGGQAAMLGTSVHGGLEEYVKLVYIAKTHQPDLVLLQMLYRKSYMDTFETADTDSDWYRDGAEMIERWFERSEAEFAAVDVISAEVKSTFGVSVVDSAGTPVTVPFNYIWDRVDRVKDSGAIRVVDYKTQRWAWNADQLKRKPQARLYGLAAQIEYPAAEEIWVDFDFLRHDPSITGVRFTKDENADTWRWLKALLKKIVDVPENVDLADIERINDDCRWCIRKATCSQLKKSTDVGGTLSLPLPALIDRRREADQQIKALKILLEESDRLIERAVRETDETELATETTKVTFGQRQFRNVDVDRAEVILGPELFSQYGGKTLTMKVVDDLLKKKSTVLTEKQKADLRTVISTAKGEPYVVTKEL